MQAERPTRSTELTHTDLLVRYRTGALEICGSDGMLIVYGSFANGVMTSDLDVAYILEDMQESTVSELATYTEAFHQAHGLRIDNEVPYANKLVYTRSDVLRALNGSCFEKRDDSIFIPAVEKTDEFLSGPNIKSRLLLNLLTSRNILLNGKEDELSALRQEAWETIICCTYSHNKNALKSPDEFVQDLTFDKFRGLSGEMFLGYKDEPHVQDQLHRDINNLFPKLHAGGKLVEINGRYCASIVLLEKIKNGMES